MYSEPEGNSQNSSKKVKESVYSVEITISNLIKRMEKLVCKNDYDVQPYYKDISWVEVNYGNAIKKCV